MNISKQGLITALIMLNVVMLALWQPWEGVTTKNSITVTGEGQVLAAPDEFRFTAVYEKKDSDSIKAVAMASEIGNVTVAKLKEIGLTEKDVTTTVTTNQSHYPQMLTPATEDSIAPDYPNNTIPTATFSIEAIARDKELAQKVLAYIATTPTTYSVSPYSTFSKDTEKRLKKEARALALTDAREQALETASTLGAKLGSLVSVSDGSSGGGIKPLYEISSSVMDAVTPSTPVLEIGEQEISYTFTVVYQIR